MTKQEELKMQDQILVIREAVKELQDKKARTSWEDLGLWQKVVLNEWIYVRSAYDLLDQEALKDEFFTGHCRLMNALREDVEDLYNMIQGERV